MKGAKTEQLEDVLVIWIGQVHLKNKTATHDFIKEQAEVHGQQIRVTNFVYKKRYVFCSKESDYSKDEQAYHIRWFYYEVQTHIPQFCLFFYPPDPNYSISHTIRQFIH